MRRTLLIALLLALLCGPATQAQNVRYERWTNGTTNGAFRRAAEKQNRTDWPIKSEGRAGTAVRLTFDPRNADADLITDRNYGTGRLLATAREMARTLNLPQTDFIRSPETEFAVNVDMEFNDYLTHPAKRVTVFDFDLARFADALLKTDLPRPIVIGIRANHSHLNAVTLPTPQGTRALEGIVFLRADEIQPGTQLHWRAEVHWSGYVAALFLFGAVILAPVTFLTKVWRKPQLLTPPSLDPTEVQKRYDKSPSMTLVLMGTPLVIGGLFMVANPLRAMESMMFLLPSAVLPICMVGGMVFLMAAVFLTPLIQKRRGSLQEMPPPDPDAPPAWTRTAFFSGLLPMMLLPLALILMLPYWNPLRSLPMGWRRTAPVWLPITLPILVLMPAVIASRVAARKLRRNLEPGDVWYDRVMAMARQAGVPVEKVIEIWSPAPNAYATIFGAVGLTRGLLHKLETEEIEAVIAHELGHHIGGHPRRAFFLSLALTFTILGLWWGFTWYVERHFPVSDEVKVILNSPMFVVFLLPFLRAFLQSRGTHNRELAGDRFAVDVTGDPELVIRALTRIHDLNATPHRFKPADEAFHSHPSLERRIAAIREYAAATPAGYRTNLRE